MSTIKNISGVSAPSRKMMRLHDTTYSPTGLWQFASGSIGTDSMGSFNLTQDPVHGAPKEVGGYMPNHQALQNFMYYRNDAADLQYTGAMSFACMFKATSYTHEGGAGDQYYRTMLNAAGGATDDRYGIYFGPTGEIYYQHKKTVGASQTVYWYVLDQLHYDLYRWHHLAFTRTSDGRTITIYLDGVQINQTTLGAGPGTAGTTYFNVGGMYSYNGGPYDGITQASCVIFDKELSADQIGHICGRCLGY
jgi:hypothetical protein